MRRVGRISLVAAGLAMLTACGERNRRLAIDDFVGDGGGTAGSATPDRASVYSIAAPSPPRELRVGASDRVVPLEPFGAEAAARPDGGDPIAPGTPWQVGEPVLMDAKVGDVNGRPILAGVFLEDLMPRLVSLRRTHPRPSVWAREARIIIANKVATTVRDEVLYREAKAQLPEELRAGLFLFLQRGRDRLQRLYGGGQAVADRELRASSGVGLEETLDIQQRTMIIGEQLRDVQQSFAPVTWTDVRNEYERRYTEFNQPTLVFSRMILATSEASAEAVRERLENGDAFGAVASDPALNRYRASSGGSIDDEGRELDGAVAEAELVGIPALNAEMVQLEPGEWAGPIEYRPGQFGFVMMERFESRSVSLEDPELQLRLWSELHWRRASAAQQAYMLDLLEAANLGPGVQARITDRLLDVAFARVFGQPSG